MAERRMFAKTIIDSDAFIDMPLSTQALYFHLSMRADDDGFINNPKKIMRMIGASEDDLKVLCLKKFIIPFDSGIVVIKHWKIHNYIRNDRKKDTVYPEEMSLLIEKDNGAYSLISNEQDLIEENSGETKRQQAYRESTLPYSFEYKIKQAFWGSDCPICGAKMQTVYEDGVASKNRIPSIQHNIPISKGGRHELGNISVICLQCNISLKDTETEKLNADEVIAKWDEICMSDKCLTSDSQVTDKCQHRLGKGSIGKAIGSIGQGSGSIGEMEDKESDNNDVDNVDNSFEMVGGTLGKGVVMLTKAQWDSLLEELGFDAFNHYVEKLANFIIEKDAKVANHYATIRKWAKEDAKV